MVSFTFPKRLKEKVFSNFHHIVVKMFFVGNTLLVSDPATVIVIKFKHMPRSFILKITRTRARIRDCHRKLSFSADASTVVV